MGDSYHDYNTIDGLLDDIIDVKEITIENTKKELQEVLHDDFETCDFDYVGTYKAVLILSQELDQLNDVTLEKELVRIRDEIAPCCCQDCLINDPVAREVYKDKI